MGVPMVTAPVPFDKGNRVYININVSYGIIDNISSLVQVMAWRRVGDKPSSDPMMVKSTDATMRHSASMS